MFLHISFTLRTRVQVMSRKSLMREAVMGAGGVQTLFLKEHFESGSQAKRAAGLLACEYIRTLLPNKNDERNKCQTRMPSVPTWSEATLASVLMATRKTLRALVEKIVARSTNVQRLVMAVMGVTSRPKFALILLLLKRGNVSQGQKLHPLHQYRFYHNRSLPVHRPSNIVIVVSIEDVVSCGKLLRTRFTCNTYRVHKVPSMSR